MPVIPDEPEPQAPGRMRGSQSGSRFRVLGLRFRDLAFGGLGTWV